MSSRSRVVLVALALVAVATIMPTASAVLYKCSTGKASTLRGGTCWSCRQGTTRNEPHAWSSKYACKIAAHYMRRSASIRRRVRHRRGAGKKCPSGYKRIGVSKSCYNCHGWKRSSPFSAHGSKACFRRAKLQLFKATLHGKAAKQCGALGQRACTVLERGPDACDKG